MISKEILILIFNVVFLATNLFYLELVENMLNVRSKFAKIMAFSVVCSFVGSLMLVLFGSMSSLGYAIMLAVYATTVMFFYKDHDFLSRLTCALYFNLHIMVARAIVTAVASLITGRTILDLSVDEITFWLLLILTSVLCTVITYTLLRIVPSKYLQIMCSNTSLLKLYTALLILGNIYLIANGMVYLLDIHFILLPVHQLIMAVCWLAATYVGVYMLVGFDMLNERKQSLERDLIYKHVVEGHSVSVIEVNCSKNKLLNFILAGEHKPLSETNYTEFIQEFLAKNTHPDDFDMLLRHQSIGNILVEYTNNNKLFTLDARTILESGDVKWIRSTITVNADLNTGDIIAIITVTDDLHSLKVSEADLQHKAHRDPLVGAYNKLATELFIKNYLVKNKMGSLFMIDLDNFKSINDTFGHAFGDDVLKEAFEKIARNFRADDILGRVGGDEFVVFLKNTVNIDEISKKATKICSEVNKVYEKNGQSVNLSCSIGIALSPTHGETFEELYHKADLAMYSCKKKMKNGYVIYEGE